MALKKKLSTRRKSQGKVKKAAKKAVKITVKKASKKRQIKRKITKKRPALKKKITLKKRKPVANKQPVKRQEGNLAGLVTHYFPHVQAAVIKLKGPLAIGDTVKIKGHTTDLSQIITSMQIDRVDITSAKKGDEIGLQVSSRVRQNDKVYKV
jgi:hypothetical protein